MREAEPEAIDPGAFAELRETLGDDPFLADLIESYVRDAARLVAAMRQAIVVRRADDLERAAHSLMGTSASLGADVLPALCHDLVALARTGAVEGADERLAAVEAEVVRVVEALQTLVRRA
jgi:HPt (histidine-containing phosphotransfer) domain-containing protein